MVITRCQVQTIRCMDHYGPTRLRSEDCLWSLLHANKALCIKQQRHTFCQYTLPEILYSSLQFCKCLTTLMGMKSTNRKPLQSYENCLHDFSSNKQRLSVEMRQYYLAKISTFATISSVAAVSGLLLYFLSYCLDKLLNN